MSGVRGGGKRGGAMMDNDLRAELVVRARRARDLHLRLAKNGDLGPGYHPEQEAIDGANADWLMGVFELVGWPGRSLVGDDGAAAVIQLMQRGTSRPKLQRRGVELLMDAAQKGEASMIDAAHFADRIAVFEGKPQLFGTQLDWDEAGVLKPALLEGDVAAADARRAMVGLPPLADLLAHARKAAPQAPGDLAERREAFDAWARKAGWR